MNVHTHLPGSGLSSSAARLDTDKSPDETESAEPQMRSANGTDAQKRGEKRPRHEAGQDDPTEISTEPKTKARRTDSASTLSLSKEAHDLKKIALIDACRKGNLEAIKDLYAQGMDLRMPNLRENSAVVLACAYGHADVVAYMLSLPGMRESVRIDTGNYLVWGHVDEHKHLQVLKLLVDAGASQRANPEQKFAVLRMAIQAGYREVVAYLLSLPEMREDAVINYRITKEKLDDTVLFCRITKESDFPLIFSACKKGQLDVMQQLLKAGARLSVENFDLRTLFGKAIKYGHADIVTFLLQVDSALAQTPINQQLGSVNNPLLLACQYGHLEVVKLLIQAGANIFEKNEGQENILHRAITSENASLVAYLLALPGMRDTTVINHPPDDGYTPLLKAIYEGNLDIVKLLMKAGANPLATMKNGDTVFHLAINMELKPKTDEVLEYLLGSNRIASEVVNQPNAEGMTPFLTACLRGVRTTVNIFIEGGANPLLTNNNGDNALHIASKRGYVTLVSSLLKRAGMSEAAVINQPNAQGFTPLLYACETNHLDDAEVLIKAGANSRAQTNNGDTALHLASIKGHTKIVNFLLAIARSLKENEDETDSMSDSDSDNEDTSQISWENKQGFTPFLHACTGGHLEVIKLLMLSGSDRSKRNVDGDGALHLACINGKKEPIAFLLENKWVHGDQHFRPNNAGMTPFVLACAGGHVHVVRYLIDAGLKGDLANLGAALSHAVINNKVDVVKLLIKAGANLTAIDVDGNTILTTAVFFARAEIIAYLLSLQSIVESDLINQRGQNVAPLDAALITNDLSIVKLLVAHGAKFDQQYIADDSLNMPVPIQAAGLAAPALPAWQFTINNLDLVIKSKLYGIAAFLIEKGLTVSVADPVLAIPYATPTEPEGIDILNHTALLTNPRTAPVHGLTDSLPTLGQAQWLTQLVSHNIATMPAAQGWQQALHTQGVSAFIIKELLHDAALLPPLSKALAGSGKRSTPAQQQYIVARMLVKLTLRLSGQTPFSGKGFAVDVEARFNHMFNLQLAAIQQAAEAVLDNTFDTQYSKLLALCTDCLSINGTINRPALSILLADTIGMFAPTAERIIVVFEDAVKLARQRGEITAQLAAAFKECLQDKQDESIAPPGFRVGMNAMPNEESAAQFFQIVFGQWRAVCLANGVQAPT
ncbi:MAG: ankyrin repeat protein 17 isoform [Pseudomonadota bacterium]